MLEFDDKAAKTLEGGMDVYRVGSLVDSRNFFGLKLFPLARDARHTNHIESYMPRA